MAAFGPDRSERTGVPSRSSTWAVAIERRGIGTGRRTSLPSASQVVAIDSMRPQSSVKRQIATSSTTWSWMMSRRLVDGAEIAPASRQLVRLVAEEADDVEAELSVVLELRGEFAGPGAGAEDEDVAPVVAAPPSRAEDRPEPDPHAEGGGEEGANRISRYGRLTSGSWAR